MPLQKSDITDISQSDTQRVDATGRVVQTLQVSFLLKGRSRITLFVDKGPDMAKRVIEAIMAEAQERIRVIDAFDQG